MPEHELLPYHPPPNGPAVLPSISKERVNALIREAALNGRSDATRRSLLETDDSFDFGEAQDVARPMSAGRRRSLQMWLEEYGNGVQQQQYLNPAHRDLMLM